MMQSHAQDVRALKEQLEEAIQKGLTTEQKMASLAEEKEYLQARLDVTKKDVAYERTLSTMQEQRHGGIGKSGWS